MEVQHHAGSSPSPSARGRGRARGRAQPHAADSDAPRPGLDRNCNKIQPALDTAHTTAAQSHSQQTNETEPPSGKGGHDAHVSQGENDDSSTTHTVQRSRRYNFDNPMMSLINKHLGQARVQRPGQSGNSRSHERLNYTSPSSEGGNSGSHTPQASYDLRLKLSRSVTPETTGRTNCVGERPRSGTFPLTSDLPVDVESSSHRTATSNAPPPDPPYRGMHDYRTEVKPPQARDQGTGRGRGRSRGRARHMDTNSHVSRPGNMSSSQLQHHMSEVENVDQFTDAGIDGVNDDGEISQIQSEMLTLTVTTKGGGVRSCAVKTNGSVEGVEVNPLVHAATSSVNDTRAAVHKEGNVSSSFDSGHGSYSTSSRRLSSQGSPGSDTGSSERAARSNHQRNGRSVSPSGSGSRDGSSGKRSPLTLHIPDEPSPSVPKPDSMKKSESESSVLSPDFLATPPGYQKILDWAAEVSSPTSPIEAPDWA